MVHSVGEGAAEVDRMTQREFITCDRCGEKAQVTKLTDHEFKVHCRCEGLISWFHGAEPPRFEGQKQGELFR